MHRLSISFEPSVGQDRVSARIRRVADISGIPVDDGPRDVRLAGGHAKSIEAEPGHYVLEAYWRNGHLTTQRCVVNGSGITELVVSPPLKQRRPQMPARDFSQPSASGMFRMNSRQGDADDAYTVFVSENASATWELLCDREEIERKTSISPEHRPVLRASDMAVHPAKGSERSWIIYWASDHWSVSSLPAAGAEEEATVLRSDPDGLPFVAVADPDMSMMTDLLPAGNAEAARRYAYSTYEEMPGDDLTRMISSRPLEVCAFAYAEHENFSNPSWTKALEGMAERHPWLSDVSIILGWRALMTAKSDDDWVAAGKLFEQAVDAGVPFYSLGVRLLAEGLTMLATEIPTHRMSAKLVCSVAARTVRSEAFTTVNL